MQGPMPVCASLTRRCGCNKFATWRPWTRSGEKIKRFHPDRAKSAYLGDLLKASGAASRSNGHWYALSFVCDASPDHLKVTSFNYRIGNLLLKRGLQVFVALRKRPLIDAAR
jgi:hypothetical protein